MNWLNLVLSAIVTSFGVYYALKNLSRINFDMKNTIIFIIFSIILYTLNGLFTGLTKPLFSILSTMFISYLTVFRQNLNKSVYYSLIQGLFSFILEMIITLMLITLFKYSLETYENVEYSMLIFSIINSILLFFVTKLNILTEFVNKYESIILDNKSTKIYIIMLTIILTLLVINNFVNYERNIEYYVNFAMLIFVIIVSIILLYNKIKKDKIEMQYNQTMEHLYKYEKIINEQGKKNHEYNNQLMVISGYADNPKKLKEYLKIVMDDHKCGQNYMIKQLGYFPDGGIKGLMYNKLGIIEELNIKPFLYVDSNIKDVFETTFDTVTYMDITKLLGVFLDNAIEAAKDSKNPEIEIEMKIDGSYLLISIGNTYSDDINIDKIGKKGFSTKGIGHGFGLSLVKDISKSNNKIETLTDVNNNMFKQIIMIDLK